MFSLFTIKSYDNLYRLSDFVDRTTSESVSDKTFDFSLLDKLLLRYIPLELNEICVIMDITPFIQSKLSVISGRKIPVMRGGSKGV